MTYSNIGKLIMKTKELNQKAISFTEKQLILLQEEHDIDDEMNEEETKELNDDPYFLLAQRLANAPQVKVNANVREEGEVLPGVPDSEEANRCPVCNIQEEDVVSHFKKFHSDVEGVVCPHCCKLLSKKCTLNRHIEQVHLGLQIFKPAKCEECGKVFSKKGHLDRHVRTIHQGVKDESEPCPHCGKVFTTKSSLEPHIEAVHKGVRRECKICGKVLSDLWKHMRTVHGQYRRKVKIPKDEVFVSPSNSTAAPLPTVAVTTSISDKTFEQINSSSPELPDMLPLSDMQTKPSQNGLSLELSFELTQPIPVLPVVPLPPLKISPQLPTKNSTKTPQPKIGSASPNKRKSSSPLKVKMPFKTKLRN